MANSDRRTGTRSIVEQKEPAVWLGTTMVLYFVAVSGLVM